MLNKKKKERKVLNGLDQQGGSLGKGSTQSSRALIGLVCILGGANWLCLTECRSKLLSALKGRLQTADWLFIVKEHCSWKRELCLRTCNSEPRSKWDGATPDEEQHRLSLHKSKNQHTLSLQTENSPTLLKTAKEKNQKRSISDC